MTSDTQSAHWLETYKSLITISIEGFKFCALSNGGAAVALLAYLGNVAGKGSATPDMRWPMAAFLLGLVLCGVSMLFSYLTQLKLLNEASRPSRISKHVWALWASILAYASSIAAFTIGAWQAVLRFH